ncbi:MAG: nucleoside-diphosphate kinase [Verrucomicrobiota bacterium]|nr:nucleoside-diphosphate kinase [Verrucomicrobiota bacterium]
MARELAFVLINPYTIAKSRTGGVIARYMCRTDLEFVAARMFGPSRELVARYAKHVRRADPEHEQTCALIADYIQRAYAPDPATGMPRRVMLLLFEGEDAIAKIWEVTGSATLKYGSGETIRDTYGDYVLDDKGSVLYFEPAVLVAPGRARAAATLNIWAERSATDGGLVEGAGDVPRGAEIQRTLVLLKPDNFRFPSARPGGIIDILSSSGLRIVGAKKFCMTVAQAEAFYAPVLESFRARFAKTIPARAAQALSREFELPVPESMVIDACEQVASTFAQQQFEGIVEFMTGYRPSKVSEAEKKALGHEGCLALVYEGVDAVRKIRAIIGTTDPNNARPGSVRREFGTNIMVNAVHASDSAESAERELAIVNLAEDTVKAWIEKYYGTAP